MKDLATHIFPIETAAEGMTGDLANPVHVYEQYKWRGFRVGAFGIALPPEQQYEIVESARISMIPWVTSICKGLLNHRSKVVPVYDLHELAGHVPRHWERDRVLILGYEQDAIAFMMYELPEEVKVKKSSENSLPGNIPEIYSKYVKEIYINDGEIWLQLNFEEFCYELSRVSMREYQTM